MYGGKCHDVVTPVHGFRRRILLEDLDVLVEVDAKNASYINFTFFISQIQENL